MGLLKQSTEEYNTSVLDYQTQIEEAPSIGELEVVSIQINATISNLFNASRGHVATLSIARGQFLIGLIDEKAPIIQAHMIASADLGGNVADVQENFNESMLAMEGARDGYKEAAILIGDGSILSDSITAEDIEKQVGFANKGLRNAYDGLSEVLESLRALYSQSPWEIDFTQFEQEEPEELEQEKVPEEGL